MMKKSFLLLAASLMVLASQALAQNCGPFRFESFSKLDSAAAANNPEQTFALSQDYPAAAPSAAYPWDKMNFKREPEKFMRTVLSYCWEGNEEVDFNVQKNAVRKWYHAPMVTRGATGREIVRGLRAERISKPKELHANQAKPVRNFSVTMYNEPGGYTFGQVWCKADAPDATKANFPAGTVMFRMVFTTADTGDVPYLLNTLKWVAYVDAAGEAPFGKKAMEDVHLLQVDIGVKTTSPDAVNGGWVFGTFVYNGNSKGTKVVDRLIPVGLQWGNDPTLNDTTAKAGAKPTECWINTAIVGSNGLVQYMGANGRLQGIVDGKSGSMLSDAGTASWPSLTTQPQGKMSMEQRIPYFRNLAGKPFVEGSASLDYNLELAMGLYNHYSEKGSIQGEPVWRGDLAQYNELEEAAIPVKAEKPPVVVPEGLVGGKLVKFIFFSILIVVLLGLLVFNLMRKPKF